MSLGKAARYAARRMGRFGFQQCGDKIPYAAKDAERAARALGMRAYHCGLCRWWHLTSSR